MPVEEGQGVSLARPGTPHGLRATHGRYEPYPRSMVRWCRYHLGGATRVAIYQGGCPSAGRTIFRSMGCGAGTRCTLKGHLCERGIDVRRYHKLGIGEEVQPVAGLRRLRPTLLPGRRGRHRGRRGAGHLWAGLQLRELWGLSKMMRRQTNAEAAGEEAGRGRRATHTAGEGRPPTRNCSGRIRRLVQWGRRNFHSPDQRCYASHTQCIRHLVVAPRPCHRQQRRHTSQSLVATTVS